MSATLRDAIERTATMIEEASIVDAVKDIVVGAIEPNEMPAVIVRPGTAQYELLQLGRRSVNVQQSIDVVALWGVVGTGRKGERQRDAYTLYEALRGLLLSNRKLAVAADGANPTTSYVAALTNDTGIDVQEYPANSGVRYIGTVFTLTIAHSLRVDKI